MIGKSLQSIDRTEHIKYTTY